VLQRHDYLHGQLAQIAERFSNVRMATKRQATIWGGTSLLTMLLDCMDELLAMTDWHWDYFLNLSESDYPIKYDLEVLSLNSCAVNSHNATHIILSPSVPETVAIQEINFRNVAEADALTHH